MIDIDAYYGRASGLSAKDCHALGYRTAYGERFEIDRGDSWIIEAFGTQISVVLSKSGWFTGIWRSTDGHTFVSDISGLMHHRPANRGDPWPVHAIPGALLGVFGLDSRTVYAWGLRGKDDFMVRWDGQRWSEMAAPQGGIIALHGTRPDLLVAVGERGMAAHWDGRRWHQMTTTLRENLSSVFVVDDDEVWACGNQGALLRGSVYGWTPVLTLPGASMTSVAKWRDEVWIATTGADGLCKLVDDEGPKLEKVRAGLVGGELDARGDLIVSTTGYLADTSDGTDFSGFAASVFRDLVVNEPIDWA